MPYQYSTYSVKVWLKLKLNTNLYSAIISEALDSRTSRLSSQTEYGEIKMF